LSGTSDVTKRWKTCRRAGCLPGGQVVGGGPLGDGRVPLGLRGHGLVGHQQDVLGTHDLDVVPLVPRRRVELGLGLGGEGVARRTGHGGDDGPTVLVFLHDRPAVQLRDPLGVVPLDHVDERHVDGDGDPATELVGRPATLSGHLVAALAERDLPQVVEQPGLSGEELAVARIERGEESFQVLTAQRLAPALHEVLRVRAGDLDRAVRTMGPAGGAVRVLSVPGRQAEDHADNRADPHDQHHRDRREDDPQGSPRR